MGKAKTHFEQIPLEVVRKVAIKEKSDAVLCTICERPVDLKKCKTDEDGSAVHETCYFEKVSHPLAIDSKATDSRSR